ncbi:MAG: helix-turn-helix domain-containing protein [Sulfuricellaceae bacterium]|nr:helix-turn-helix domain-containing protein [Sulfuricellaceae bacterium]
MRTLNVAEAASFLKVAITSVEELAKDGLIPAAKIGRSWVFTEHHLADYLSAQIEQQTSERRDLLAMGRPTRVKTNTV